jgi:hypothetical protein
MDQYGQFQTLPEGVIYSSNANNGRGGFIKTSDFVYPGGGGGGGGRGWGWGGGSGWGSSQYGNPYGRYSKRNWMYKNRNADSPIAQILAQKEANKYNNQPKNQWMFTQMLQSMPGGGITEAI